MPLAVVCFQEAAAAAAGTHSIDGDGARDPPRRGAARPPRRRRPAAARRRHARAAGAGPARLSKLSASRPPAAAAGRPSFSQIHAALAFERAAKRADRRVAKRASLALRSAPQTSEPTAFAPLMPPPPINVLLQPRNGVLDATKLLIHVPTNHPRTRRPPTTGWNVQPSNSKSRFIASRRDTRAYS